MTDRNMILQDGAYDTALAIVGMSGRFPGASNIQTLWQNLINGVISIQTFTEQELLDAGLDRELIQHPQFVKAGTILEGMADFDASFFGFTPREAECLDPQHRLFLECAWEALEQAGYPPDSYKGLIGVFAGSHPSDYLRLNLLPHAHLLELMGKIQLSIGNDCDALASMVSYKMNLKGPGISVQTFCSTSLVATHLACQSLLTYECDIALAGGAAIMLPQPSGYLYEEGGILSPDGKCYTFDAQAQGSVMGNGVGVIALKRLKEALKDGDHIYAMIRGSATNNDGGVRVGYTAPGLNGQSAVIADAITQSGVPFESISYIEAHGTGTKLGDAIELAALQKAFAAKTSQRQFCALGSFKPNIGHLDRASGVTGLIKTALSLYHGQIPPSLNFERTSSDIHLETGPFFVNTRLQAWQPGPSGIRRAGVNSFGLGGTNAHVVLEEAPQPEESQPCRVWKLLPLAARSREALAEMALRLADYLIEHEACELADVAYTLQVGRTPFLARHTLVCRERTEAIALLKAVPEQPATQQGSLRRPTILLFPDTPAVASLGWDLIAQEPRIREALQPGLAFIRQHFQCDLDGLQDDVENLERTQCKYVLWSYGLAQLLQSWGVELSAVAGEGAGSLAAAVVAGIISLPDGLRLTLAQAQGADTTEIAHLLESCELHAPQVPVASTTHQGWLTKKQGKDVHLLARHLLARQPEIEALLEEREALLLNVGYRSHWIEQIQQDVKSKTEQFARFLTFWSSETRAEAGQEALLRTIGRLWERGASINWKTFSSQERRLRVPLPTYPFERRRFWIDQESPVGTRFIAPGPSGPSERIDRLASKLSRDDWFYLPSWQQVGLAPDERPALADAYLIFFDAHGVGEQLAKRLELRGGRVIRVLAGPSTTPFTEEQGGRIFRFDRTQRNAYQRLFERLAEMGAVPDHMIHCSCLTASGEVAEGAAGFQAMQELGLYSLLFLLQAHGQQTGGAPLTVTVLSNAMQNVSGNEPLSPAKSPLLGLCKVASQENPQVLCRSIDLESLSQTEQIYEQLLAAILSQETERTVAYRQRQRWIETYTPKKIAAPASLPLRPQGVYLITGGLGGIGLILARYLAQQVQARLALVSRTALPPRETWSDWLASNEPHDVTSRRIQQIQALEALGSEVLILQADVANTHQMNEVVAHTAATFGQLNGIIYAAGVSDPRAFGSVQELGRDICDWHFGPKVHGLYALEQALQGRAIDFCMLFSSLSTVLGGLGLSGYTAANRFMDAFAAAHNRHASTPWICVDWDSWQVKEHPHGDFGATIAAFTMTPEEGTDAFVRALTSGATHLVHSTGDLAARIKQWIHLESLGDGEADRQSKTPGQAPVPADYERVLTEIWKQTLGLEQVGLTDNFFDLGGNSLIALQLTSRIRKTLQVQLPAVAIFEAPTISTMAQYLRPADVGVEASPAPTSALLAQRRLQARQSTQRSDIAIVGMAGRFPGASTVEQYWQNLRNGVEALTFFSEEELLASGLEPALINNPAYVRARPILKTEEVEGFDAAFFGYSPREAELTDPQHRLFLECCWEALEHAGYDAERYPGMIGLFGGTNISNYMLGLAANPELLDGVDDYQLIVGNDKDSLATSISYKMNLRGPSLTIQTFCSTSLVATHLACQSLLNGECDLAMAGGVSLRIPFKAGYLYQQGGQESLDGHCYTFDARASGSTFGDGAGVVVLKRLADALADSDTIHAVIKGSAINNDGSLKVSYTAPSVNGQAEVVMQALTHAGLSPEQISYIEAHGTATELGDPIEVASLTKAFRSQTQRTNFCAIGSVKTNVGHMDRAAGVSGLIKVVESLKHGEIPPSLNFETPNPAIDFASSPFYVNTGLVPWPRSDEPRRAGVNSLGMGGTNVHVIVEEAPEPAPSGPARPYQLLLLSARTPSALEAASQRLSAHLLAYPNIPLADIAYTLQVGRKQMEQRTVLVCRDREDALAQLGGTLSIQQERRIDRPVALLFSGVGEQYAGMAGDLYAQEPVFRECVDRCCTFLLQRFQLDLLPLFSAGPTVSNGATGTGAEADALKLVPTTDTPGQVGMADMRRRSGTTDTPGRVGMADAHKWSGTADGLGRVGIADAHRRSGTAGVDLRALVGRGAATQEVRVSDPVLAQCSTFVLEYALTQVLRSWGIRPQALLGYSLGEYIAATVAGVFSLEDALGLVVQRARLVASLPSGAMLAVFAAPEQVQPFLHPEEGVEIAIFTSPSMCVLAGPEKSLEQVAAGLRAAEIVSRFVESASAFHSSHMAPIRAQLSRLIEAIPRHLPAIPYLSNVTGDWITAEQVQDAGYWARHLCEPVQFSACVKRLLGEKEWLLLEVGIGQMLSGAMKQHPACDRESAARIVATLPSFYEQRSTQEALLRALGQLWQHGASIDWLGFVAHERRLRVPLPTYPFERQRYWLHAQGKRQQTAAKRLNAGELDKIEDLADWFFLPSWTQKPSPKLHASEEDNSQIWALLMDDCGVGEQLFMKLQQRGCLVITVHAGDTYAQMDATSFQIRPTERDDYHALLRTLNKHAMLPSRFVHLWSVTGEERSSAPAEECSDMADTQGFYSLLALAQVLGNMGTSQFQIDIISSDMQDVTGNERLNPLKSLIIGPCKVIQQEYTHIRCRSIDLAQDDLSERLCDSLMKELLAPLVDTSVALRGWHRWIQTYEPLRLEECQPAELPLRPGGIYLITGGLGGIGLALAEYLARKVQARLVLVGRSTLPPREEWEEILTAQGNQSGIGRRIHQVQVIEALGSPVMLATADVAEEVQMRAVLEQTLTTFGALHGVIHAAALPPSGLIQLKTSDQAAQILAPKVQGTVILDRLLKGYQLDFLLLFSSMSSSTGGGPGQVDYCAANAFLDAFAHKHSAEHGMTVAIDWGEWQWDAWSAGLEGFPPEVRRYFIERRRDYGISFSEGMEALSRVLAHRLTHVVVATQNFPQMVEGSKNFSIDVIVGEVTKLRKMQSTAYPRPALSTPYVAPENEFEELIAQIWGELLGIEQIGIHDNFFELGGHSLLGAQLIARLRQHFQLDLSLEIIFESSTVAELAIAIELAMIEEIEQADTHSLAPT